MTDRMALLQSVLANPDDDIPRLVYADWLEEFGSDADVARAHFIRVEIEAEGMPANSPERIEAESAAAKLFNKHGTTWNAELPNWSAWYDSSLVYRRGFVEELRTVFRRFALEGDEILRAAPITRLQLSSRTGGVMLSRDTSSTRKQVTQIRWLQIGPHIDLNTQVPRGMWNATNLFNNFSNLTNLKTLVLANNTLDDEMVARIQVHFPIANFADTLTELDLSDNRITDAGAWLLATAREMSPIVRLNLSGNDIGPDAARALRNRYGDGLTL